MERRAFVRSVATAVGAAVLPPLRADADPASHMVERWSWAMGQAVHLTMFADSDARAYDAAGAAFAELRRIEARLSIFDDASDLSELNRRAGRRPMRMDDDLAAILRAGSRFRQSTAGAFDLAVEPLMRAWGFRSDRAVPPSRAELAEVAEAVRNARIRLRDGTAQLASTDARIDAGSIGVGYGLDRAVAVLRRYGIRSALLDISGDCFAIGTPPGRRGWLVSVVDSARPTVTLATRYLREAALATSANTVSIRRFGSLVAGHVMDPAAARPARALAQATVVARSGVAADALSTAMLVAGHAPAGVVVIGKVAAG